MKPTEADIQAELIEGWEIQQYFDPIPDKIRIIRQSLAIGFYEEDRAIIFNYRNRCETKTCRMSELLRGDCDLSAISDYYSHAEWQRIITMCKRIVRLITGEQVEQTLEEKVREILEPLGLIVAYVHDDEVSVCNKLHQFWITSTHIRWASEEKTIEEYHDFDGYYRDEFEQVSKLLTAQPESEQTLEEAVRGIMSDSKWNVVSISDTSVRIGIASRTITITADSVAERFDGDTVQECTVESYLSLDHGENVKRIVESIAALLSTRTKPSYSDLEQRVEELEKESIRYEERISTHGGTIKTLEKDVERLERENASLLDKFGPIDQAEQQVAEVETRFQKLAKKAERIADIMIQLNEEIL